jgi:glycosyltransferase involved in cell wall biosynthesis
MWGATTSARATIAGRCYHPGVAGPARILVVHPDLRPPGGGNAVTAWAIQALAARHEVSVLTWSPPPLDAVDRFYGTSLAGRGVRFVSPRPAARAVHAALGCVPTPLYILRGQLLAREAKRLAPRFDLLFSTENEMDLGGRGVQYVHYPWLRRAAPTGLRGLLLRRGAPLDLYYRVAFALSDYDPAAMRANLTLVNSDWTGARVREIHGIDSVTVYPPVALGAPRSAPPWEQRVDGFVAVGRLAPEKRIDLMLDVVAALRERGHAATFHLVASGRPDARTRAVLRRARALPWVTISRDLPRAALLELLARHRYGLHAMRDEHFGIAVAEMVAAGCIPFVPEEGGQTEIVDHPALIYRDRDDAVARILAVRDDPARQEELRRHLAARRDRFSTERFAAATCDAVERALATRA